MDGISSRRIAGIHTHEPDEIAFTTVTLGLSRRTSSVWTFNLAFPTSTPVSLRRDVRLLPVLTNLSQWTVTVRRFDFDFCDEDVDIARMLGTSDFANVDITVNNADRTRESSRSVIATTPR